MATALGCGSFRRLDGDGSLSCEVERLGIPAASKLQLAGPSEDFAIHLNRSSLGFRIEGVGYSLLTADLP